MSKKMFKRSLALGALMAFVITGNAMAQSYDVSVNLGAAEEKPATGIQASDWDVNINVDMGNGNWKIENMDGDGINAGANGLITIENGKTLDIEAKDIGIYTSAKSRFEVETLKILAGHQAMSVYGKTDVIAKNVDLMVNNGHNVLQINKDLNLGSDNNHIGLLSIGGEGYSRAIRVSDATANIYADTLNISGATEATKVSSGTLKLVVNEAGSITNEFYADKDGTVDATFGAGVNWTGKFVTAGNATKGTLDLSGTWTLKEVFPNDDDTPGEANSLTEATFRKGSTFVIDGATYENNDGKNVSYALNGVGDKATLTVENGAKLTVTGIDKNTYNIAKGFETITGADKWEITDLNTLMEGKWLEDETKGLQLQVVAKEAETLATEMGVSESTAQSIASVNDAAEKAKANGATANPTGTGDDKAVAFVEAMADAPSEVAGQAYEAVSKMAEAGGNSATAANVVNNVTNVTGQRLSFGGGGGHHGGHHGGNKGGHGVGLFEEGSGAAIWAQYVHGKDSVDGMESSAGASSYEGQYNGIVMGVDFKKVGKFQSGIAFNYGEGDTNSVDTSARTRSDYDFWGVGYYGNIRNADTNFIFDVNYAKTESDVTTKALNMTYEASPETTTWTAGVKVEKLYQNNNVQIVPYAGLRFMSIDPEDYTTECASSKYKMERQNIWLMPVGVSIRQDVVNNNGWTVSPKVDLSYIWAFGDTDSEMEFSTLDTKTPIQYEVMDDGSWMGLVGVEAAMDDWTFGVSYSYQKGDHSESKKWYVDAKYSF